MVDSSVYVCVCVEVTELINNDNIISNSKVYSVSIENEREFLAHARRAAFVKCVSISESLSLPTMSCEHFIVSQPTPFQLSTLRRISLSMCRHSSKTLALHKSCTYLLKCVRVRM